MDANDLLISCLPFLSFLFLLTPVIAFSTFLSDRGDFWLCLLELPLFGFAMSVIYEEEWKRNCKE
jgi:hypothetical protein